MEMVRLCKAGTGSSGYHPRSWLPSYRVGWSAALHAAALAPSSSAQRSDQSCRRSWPESRCVPSFGKGRCAYYFFMTFQLEFLKQFKGGWHFKDTCWMDYGPPIHLCGMFSSPANPSVSKNIPPYSKVPTGIHWTSPWESGRTEAPIHGMLALQQKAQWTCWMDLKLFPPSPWKSIQQNCCFQLGQRCQCFFTVSILQFHQKCFKQKTKEGLIFPECIEQAIMIWACWAFFSATCRPMVNCPCLSL